MSVPSFPSPEEVRLYHQHMVEALTALSRQFDVVVHRENGAFFNFTRKAFDQTLYQTREELDQQVVLTLVASAEAVFRRDFERRVRDTSKDVITARFQSLERKFENEVRLDAILDIWKEETGGSEEIGDFKQHLRRRHWLAHGRHWVDKSGVQPTPESTSSVITELFRHLRATVPDFPRR